MVESRSAKGRKVMDGGYEYQQDREYINAVYLQGALMMDALRSDWRRGVSRSLQAYARQMRVRWPGRRICGGCCRRTSSTLRAPRGSLLPEEHAAFRPVASIGPLFHPMNPARLLRVSYNMLTRDCAVMLSTIYRALSG